MAEFPWFPCYPSDWLSSQTVQLLTLEQEGAFFRLLCYAWLNDACALPKDERLLRRLSKWDDSAQDFTPVLACFKPHPTKPEHLYNCRLYKEWIASRERQAMLQDRAQKGAEARWAEKPRKVHTLKPSTGTNGHTKGKRPISEDDKPTERNMNFGRSIGVDVGPQWGKFKNYCLAHDKRYANFEAAFRNWLANVDSMKGARA